MIRQTLRTLALFATLLLLGFAPGCAAQQTTDSERATPRSATSDPDKDDRDVQGVPLFDGLDAHKHAIQTDKPRAQAYFNQGLVLSFGFNHAEAARSFRKAAQIDPTCAMCFWGEALVLGPNINAAMSPENVEPAWKALQQAKKLAPKHASPRHRAYIDALSERYAKNPPEDRSQLDRAYAKAMGKVARDYPDDPDAAVLYAEALMDEHPWDFWQEDGEPQPWTPRILKVLERVLDAHPQHPLANHLYIHAVEASPTPERAMEHADRLRDLVPGAGHLVHMPAHIYIRTGRYHAASEANERAAASDERYVTQCHASGIYPIAYHPHNYHFLWATTTMEGRSDDAISAARKVRSMVDPKMMRKEGFGTLQHYYSIPYYALVTFGEWDAILEEPKPAADLLYPTGVWHFSRGMAFVHDGDLDAAEEELKHVRELAADERVAAVTIWDINSTADLLQIGAELLDGELAKARGNYADAISHLERGVELEDSLNYDEPPPWGQPIRRYLGAVLLEADKPARAETVYRAELDEFPANGWSLFGLAEALEEQGKSEQAREVRTRFQKAWQYADVELNASAF